MTDKEIAKQILDRLEEWATLDAPAAEWFPDRVEQIISAAVTSRLARAKDAIANLGAELAMATNALPSRRIAGLMEAFREMEEALNNNSTL